MQTRLSLLLSTLLALTSVAIQPPLAASDETESRRSFNQNWLFHWGDYEDARFPETEDQHWRPLNLPHSPQISNAEDSHSTPTETIWYRKRFDVANTRKGQPVSIYFEGITGSATVWINGHRLSNNSSTPKVFHNDITPYLRYSGEPNVIAIRLQRKRPRADDSRRLALGGDVWLQFNPPS